MRFDTIADPVFWVLALLAAGLALIWMYSKKKLHRSWYLVLAGTVILYVLSLSPVANSLSYYLEKPYAKASLKDIDRADAIIILGGGVFPASGFRHRAEPMAWNRMVVGIDVFKRSHAKYLVLSGGAGRPGEKEADAMKYWAIRLGVKPEKVILESRSTNTSEQAEETSKLLASKRAHVVGLVTSATHMRRSMMSFKRHFKGVIPLPSHFAYNPKPIRPNSFLPSSYALLTSKEALHEIIGYFWYQIKLKFS